MVSADVVVVVVVGVGKMGVVISPVVEVSVSVMLVVVSAVMVVNSVVVRAGREQGPSSHPLCVRAIQQTWPLGILSRVPG